MKVKICKSSVEIDESFILDSEYKLRKEVNEYLNGNLKKFSVRYNTPDNFTGAVMNALADIPYDSTCTYGEIANRIDSSPIAVGQGCGNNPLPILVPCHRVVRSNGVGGYLGESDNSNFKKMLIDLESSNS